MTRTKAPSIVLALHGDFFEVDLPFADDPSESVAVLRHVALGTGSPKPPRLVPMPVLRALIDAEEAIEVDARLIEASRRRLDALARAGRPLPGAGAMAAFGRLLVEGRLRSAASMVGHEEPELV